MGCGFKQPLVGEKRCVTTLITAAEGTNVFHYFRHFVRNDQNKLSAHDKNRKRAELWVKMNLFLNAFVAEPHTHKGKKRKPVNGFSHGYHG